jgi:hypothetical protein
MVKFRRLQWDMHEVHMWKINRYRILVGKPSGWWWLQRPKYDVITMQVVKSSRLWFAGYVACRRNNKYIQKFKGETLWTKEEWEGDGKLALVETLGKWLSRMGGEWNLLRIVSFPDFGISALESLSSAVKKLEFEGLICVRPVSRVMISLTFWLYLPALQSGLKFGIGKGFNICS